MDGEHTYYSNYSNQYVLNGNTWEAKTWEGLTKIDGYGIWTDGEHTYYSYYSYDGSAEQYVLNGDKWEVKNWVGLSEFSGNKIWFNGTDCYYFNGMAHYKLQK